MGKHSHYHKSVKGRETIDVYDVLDLFEVKSHAVGHAIKKLLMAGQRGAKDYRQDLSEAIDSITRQLEMVEAGWIAWAGGEMPVGRKSKVQIKTENQESPWNNDIDFAMNFGWNHDLGGENIIAYRVVESESEA